MTVDASKTTDPATNAHSCQQSPDYVRGLEDAARAVSLNAWAHQGTDAYSAGMDAGARHQSQVDHAAIRALIATPPDPVREAATRVVTVTVNPLVWEKHPMGWIAAPPTGQAYIIDIRVKGRVMFIKGMNPSPQCSNIEAAKAAAQADYDARIRAVITLTSGASPDTIAKSDDFVSLPRVEVEALMETITIQCGLLTMGCGGAQHRIDIVAERIIKALATLQERMK